MCLYYELPLYKRFFFLHLSFGYSLMDVDQGVKYEYHKKSYSRKRGGFLLQVSEMCWVDKCIWNFKGRLTWLSVLLCTMFFFQYWSNKMSIATCALTKLELVITIFFGGWWPREWWKTWIWGVSRGVFLAPQSVYVWVFVFWLSVTILVSWESMTHSQLLKWLKCEPK